MDLDFTSVSNSVMASFAILFFGIVDRSIGRTGSSIRRRIVRPLQRQGDVDLFFHSWQLEEIDETVSSEGFSSRSRTFSSAFPCAQGIFESQHDFDRDMDWNPYYRNSSMWPDARPEERRFQLLRNHRRAIESLARCHQFYLEHRERSHDFLVIARPDVLYRTTLRLPAHIETDELLVPDFHHWGGVNDRFAVGPPDAITAYCNRRAFVDEHVASNQHEKSEQLLAAFLREKQLKTRSLPLFFQRIRSDGSLVPQDLTSLGKRFRQAQSCLQRVKTKCQSFHESCHSKQE